MAATRSIMLIALSVLVLLGYTTSFARSAFAERRYAVIIGNNVGAEDETPLRFAEKDAASFAQVLRRLGDVPAQNTVTIAGGSASEVRQALLEVNARIRHEEAIDANSGSTLVVYYSGHADARGLHPGNTILPFEELRAMVEGSAARVRVLILDACRSGGLTHVKGGQPAQAFDLRVEKDEQVEGLVLISSSAAGEDSHESERLGGSFFTHHFTSALVGAGDKNRDGKVTLNEAYAYAYHQTLRASGRTTSLQHPTYAYDLRGRGELVMTRLGDASGRSAGMVLDEPGLYLILQGEEDGPVVAEVTAERAQTKLTLPPGEYFVQRRASDHYREYRVSLAASGLAKLSETSYREVAYARLVRKGGGDSRSAHGVFVGLGGRGQLLKRMGPSPNVMLTYALDLEWASVGLRARVGRSLKATIDPGVRSEHTEIAIGMIGQHFIDFSWLSVGVGMFGEAVHHRQTFFTRGIAPPRQSIGLALGGVLTFEREFGASVIRIEGGPMTEVFKRTVTNAGVAVGTETATPLTGWAALSVGWRF